MGGNFEPHHVAMETVGVGREKEQSREEMGSTRGRGAWLLDCAGEMNVYLSCCGSTLEQLSDGGSGSHKIPRRRWLSP